jgi:acetolactate synthase-1/2/3 large subunit
MKLSDYVFARVAACGVRHVFLLPGGGAMHLVDSLGRNRDLQFVCNLHEQGTAVAVDAYAQVAGFGVGLVTTGPGGTNCLTGVTAAWLDSTPCLFISGQVKRADSAKGRGVRQFGFQEVDIISMVRPITKYAALVDDPRDIRQHLDRALRLARQGRPGPVWIDIPLDVQAAEVDPETLPGEPAAEVINQDLAQSDLDAAAARTLEMLGKACRPVILVGNGVRLSGAAAAFDRIARRLGVPVLATWKAADLMPDDHPLFAGRPGASGQRHANLAQQNSDVLLALGARLDLGQTAYEHRYFARAAQRIVVDVDGAEVAKFAFPVALGIVADAAAFLAALERVMGAWAAPDWANWRAKLGEWRARFPVIDPEVVNPTGCIDTYALVAAVGDLLRPGDVLAPGSSGQCSELTCQAVRLRSGVRMVNSQGLGSMGFGVPGALGACLGSGGARTVCIDGDGGFQMNLQELETIRRLRLPIHFLVLDNQGYGSIRSSQRTHFAGNLVASDASSGLTLPDSARLAEAYGIRSQRLDDAATLRQRLADTFAHPGPTVSIVTVPVHQATRPRVASMKLGNGSMVSRPMEDMEPLLPRDEFASLMLIPPVEP